MRALNVVLIAAAVACAAAFPAKFYSVTTFTASTTCTGAVGTTSYYGLNQCIVDGTSSTMYTETADGRVSTSRYTGVRDCSGTPTVLNATWANNQCDASSTQSAKYAFPATGPFWSTTSWTSADCSGTPTDGPSYNLIGACIGSTGTSAMYRQSGNKLEGAIYSGAGCTGDATATFEIENGLCGSSRSGSGSTRFDFNSAAARAPQFIVAAIAMLLAVVSFRL